LGIIVLMANALWLVSFVIGGCIGLVIVAFLVLFWSTATKATRQKFSICCSLCCCNVFLCAAILGFVFYSHSTAAYISLCGQLNDNEDVCQQTVGCAWCVENDKKSCIAYDCTTQKTLFANCTTTPETNYPLDCLGFYSPHAQLKLKLASAIVGVVLALVSGSVAVTTCYLSDVSWLQKLTASFGAVGGMWICIVFYSLIGTDMGWVPKTDPTTALALGFVFVSDFKRVIDIIEDAHLQRLEFWVLWFGILWIWLFELVDFYTSEELSPAWIAAITFGILLIDTTVSYEHILHKPVKFAILEFGWIALIGLGCIITFIANFVDYHSGHVAQVILDAALLAEEFLVPTLSDENKSPLRQETPGESEHLLRQTMGSD